MLIKFNGKRLLGFQDKLLLPGINDLHENFVADMLNDEILAAKFESNELEILGRDDVGAKVVKTPEGEEETGLDLLLAASDSRAKELATQTVDIALLDLWLVREKRTQVKKAIKVQIAKIKDVKFRDEKKPKKETQEE